MNRMLSGREDSMNGIVVSSSSLTMSVPFPTDLATLPISLEAGESYMYINIIFSFH